jgi:phage terminase large subunit
MIMTRLAQSVRDLDGGLAVPKLIMDCNPRGPRHWLFLAGVRHLDPETQEPFRDSEKWARLNWSAYDNTENLPKEYLKTLEALPEVMRDRMLKGVWRSNEGAVYDEFNEDIHVVDDFNIPADWKRIRAVDFGYTNPFVCLWGALDPDGRLYLYREHYQAKVRTALHAEKIKKFSENEKIFLTVADHDAGERAELQAGGIYTQPAKKNVQQGIQAVKNRLAVQEDGKPRLFFCKSMSNTLSEIYDYLWEPDNRDLNAKEAPVKMNDHAMDALRYMVMCIDTGSPNYHGTCSTSGTLDERWN